MEMLIELFKSVDIDIAEIIDIKLTFGLISLGFCIKHLPFLSKLSNEYIPLILIIFSLIVNYISIGAIDIEPNIIVNTFVNSLLTSAVAIGMHQQGKAFLKSLKEAGTSAVGAFVEELTNDDTDTE